MAEGDGWWIGGCYIENYDSSEIDLRFTPSSIEPGETANMTLWVNASPPYEYNEEDDNFLERNIILEPNLGSVSRTGNGVYKYTAPSSTPGDSALVVKVNYEQFTWHCAGFDGGKTDTSHTNNAFEEQCGCPLWLLTRVWRDYGIDSIMIAWDSLDVIVEPDTIYPGDTAQVVIKKRLPDGTLTDFDSIQTYEAGMLDGCIFGKLVAGAQEGPYVVDVLQPIYFIADTSADTTGAVLLRVGLVEQVDKQQNKNRQQQDFVESDCFIGEQFGSYEDVTVIKDNPLKIIYPKSNTIQWITTEPQMPDNPCSAIFLKSHSGVIKYEWKFIVTKHYERKTPGGSSICERISRSEFQGISYSDLIHITTWDVPFDKDSGYFYFKAVQEVQNKYHPKEYYGCDGDTDEWYDETSDEIFTGGEVFITITAKDYQTGEILATLVEVPSGKILGENPNPQAIYDYANSNKIKAILQIESKEYHFIEQDYILSWWPYNEVGWPIYGPPNGYGLMQLDKDPAGTERQLWNWKANIDGGKAKLQASYNVVAENHGVANEDEYNWTNAFHEYNHGNGRTYYKWIGRKWDLDPDRKDSYGKTVYEKYTQLGGGN